MELVLAQQDKTISQCQVELDQLKRLNFEKNGEGEQLEESIGTAREDSGSLEDEQYQLKKDLESAKDNNELERRDIEQLQREVFTCQD
eukprot:CAMPEP_0170541398 /NCGR_PEP_ID=MMETSP0211-20121228/1141_1 /TAXON_ID=311385 /ORGANISM="Pseudokeronopsis sp., Strain OXSARD2" /LENGTH=87 /DNA_ID=CAMNT_0010844109 /DNA_START=503 /DNA_END=766 /DNA_ORIENTATION=+